MSSITCDNDLAIMNPTTILYNIITYIGSSEYQKSSDRSPHRQLVDILHMIINIFIVTNITDDRLNEICHEIRKNDQRNYSIADDVAVVHHVRDMKKYFENLYLDGLCCNTMSINNDSDKTFMYRSCIKKLVYRFIDLSKSIYPVKLELELEKFNLAQSK